MNYLTAIIATPLFLLIWALECWMAMKYGARVRKANRGTLMVCLAVSTLQMVSCWFWLFGFVYSKKLNTETGEWEVGVGVLSEAVEPDEETNCTGLVGAEVLLAVFQSLFTMITISQALAMHQLVERTKPGKSGYTTGDWTLSLAALCLGVYVMFGWFTAFNRRCQRGGQPKWAKLAAEQDESRGTEMLSSLGMNQGGSSTVFDSVWVPWQHHFYPVFLIFDSIFGLVLYNDVNKLAKAFTSAGGEANQTVKTFQKFFKFEAQAILAGCALAVLIFVFQFMLEVKALSMLACIFCVLMYVTYALRRVPMVMLFVQFPPFVRKFGLELEGSGGNQVAPAPKAQKSTTRQDN